MHHAKNVTVGSCTESPLGDGEYYQLTQGTSSNQYVYWFNCTAGCTSCAGNVTQYLGVCGPSVSHPDGFVLITSAVCTGGLDSSANAVGAVFNLVKNSTSCVATNDFEDFNFGTNASCQPFLSGTWGQLIPNADGNFSANLFCPNSSCDGCAVEVDSTFGCLFVSGVGSWNVVPLGSLSTCASGSSSKLSTGAIVGIAIGSAVGAIGLIAVIVWLAKSSRGGYSDIKS